MFSQELKSSQEAPKGSPEDLKISQDASKGSPRFVSAPRVRVSTSADASEIAVQHAQGKQGYAADLVKDQPPHGAGTDEERVDLIVTTAPVGELHAIDPDDAEEDAVTAVTRDTAGGPG